MQKKHTTVHKKCVPLVRKIVLVTFAVTHSFSSPKDFQQTPNGNTAGKFKGILHEAVKGGIKFSDNLHA